MFELVEFIVDLAHYLLMAGGFVVLVWACIVDKDNKN